MIHYRLSSATFRSKDQSLAQKIQMFAAKKAIKVFFDLTLISEAYPSQTVLQ